MPGINYKFNTKKYRYFYGSRVELSPHPYKVKHFNTRNMLIVSASRYHLTPLAEKESDWLILTYRTLTQSPCDFFNEGPSPFLWF